MNIEDKITILNEDLSDLDVFVSKVDGKNEISVRHDNGIMFFGADESLEVINNIVRDSLVPLE